MKTHREEDGIYILWIAIKDYTKLKIRTSGNTGQKAVLMCGEDTILKKGYFDN